MQPPKFWFTHPDHLDWRAHLLAPMAAVYAATTARRVLKRGDKFGIPVICIGNLNLGGTGKTPTVIALLDRLQKAGLTPHIVSRGYGGAEVGPLRVDPRRHAAADVGDEPLLIAEFAPTWVSRDRTKGVAAAETDGAELVILDDGFQNPSVSKDISVIVVDAASGFGNGRVVPSGPLREPVLQGMKRADLLLLIGAPEQRRAFRTLWADQVPVPILDAELCPLQTGMDWQDLAVLAFAGIGRPEKFFATLRDLGCRILHAEPLSDHQPLTPALMRRLESEASAMNAQLVTTEKDAVRLPDAFRQKVLTVPVRLEIEDWTPLDQVIGKLDIALNGTG